tara:strand:- start:109 stop:522 length:414 start_codon:yes stop_codon:yes gene_type:complete
MRCAISIKRLMSTFHIPAYSADLIRTLCAMADDPCGLEDEIDTNDFLDSTESYVRSLYRSPYRSAMWRRTVILHAINVLIDGCGIECSTWDQDSARGVPDREYINVGDTYALTLVYSADSDNLFIGTFGDSVAPFCR